MTQTNVTTLFSAASSHTRIIHFVLFFSFPSYFSCMLQSSTPSSSSGGFREPLPPPEPTVEASGSTQNEEDPLTQTQAAKPARSDPGKVPKWLKLPGQDRKQSTHTKRKDLCLSNTVFLIKKRKVQVTRYNNCFTHLQQHMESTLDIMSEVQPKSYQKKKKKTWLIYYFTPLRSSPRSSMARCAGLLSFHTDFKYINIHIKNS